MTEEWAVNMVQTLLQQCGGVSDHRTVRVIDPGREGREVAIVTTAPQGVRA